MDSSIMMQPVSHQGTILENHKLKTQSFENAANTSNMTLLMLQGGDTGSLQLANFPTLNPEKFAKTKSLNNSSINPLKIPT
jgi:hypothetical protein